MNSGESQHGRAFLDGASTNEQVVYQYNRSHDQQEMNQAGTATYTESKTQ